MSTKQRRCFVIMPFSEQFKNTREAIENALTHHNIDISIINEKHFTGKIVDEIYTEIVKADFIIADISIVAKDMFIDDKCHSNSNVCYEVGYARGLEKPIILVSDSVRKTAFDMAGYNQIKYNKLETGALKKELIARIENIIKTEITKDILCFAEGNLKNILEDILMGLSRKYNFSYKNYSEIDHIMEHDYQGIVYYYPKPQGESDPNFVSLIDKLQSSLNTLPVAIYTKNTCNNNCADFEKITNDKHRLCGIPNTLCNYIKLWD